jgi:hypothetical protein
MRCTSCNKELTDRESVHKDATKGTFYDLCGRCLSESMKALAVAEATAEIEQFMREDTPKPTCKDPIAAFEEAVKLQWDTWGDGLGIMKPLERRIFLYGRAKSRFLASQANGDRLNISMDIAFKRMPKRNGMSEHAGETFAHSSGGVEEGGMGGASISDLYQGD